MTKKDRDGEKYRGNSIDGFFYDEHHPVPGPHVTTPILDYPEHSNRHRMMRIVREPSPVAPNRVDRLIDVLIAHQVTAAMLLWLIAVALLTWLLV